MKKLLYFTIFILLIISGAIGYYFFAHQDNIITYPGRNKLFIPKLIDSRVSNHNIQLTMQKTQHEFFSGVKSNTMGINQSYLGPSIRLYKGEQTHISIKNEIDEPTTMHGHGLIVNGEVDGGPQSKIFPGTTKKIILPITQEAGTSWYHPHLMGKTADHVHAGLAGLYLIEDENSQNLSIPKEYGVNDIPLIIQDRSFVGGKMQHYKTNNNQLLDGLREETLIVNGTINSYQVVPANWIRLRLLNASNARFYSFFFTDNTVFYKIATEGGFLNNPVPINQLTMAPGERNEIMIDLSHIDKIHLIAELLESDPDDDEPLFGFSFPKQKYTQNVLELITDTTLVGSGNLPEVLNNIDFYDPDDENIIYRNIKLEMDTAEESGPINKDNMFSINGEPMKMGVINERVRKGDLEIWTVTAELMPHPFHIHGVSFQILTHNGKRVADADRGWKDTVVVTGEPTQLIMRFNHVATEEFPYMYHCHILEHEDIGMMGQFTVEGTFSRY